MAFSSTDFLHPVDRRKLTSRNKKSVCSQVPLSQFGMTENFLLIYDWGCWSTVSHCLLQDAIVLRATSPILGSVPRPILNRVDPRVDRRSNKNAMAPALTS